MIATRPGIVLRTMIITCPNCQTKYQVADQAIGAAGRKVMCANCHQAWKAVATPPETRPKPKLVAGTDRFSEPEPAAPADPPDPDKLFSSDSEAALDQAFSDEEERNRRDTDPFEDTAPESDFSENEDEDEAAADSEPDSDEDDGAIDHHLMTRRRRDLAKRQKKHASRLPMARIRRVARMTALIGFLTLIGLGYQFRVDIVRTYPDLGGLYEAIGLPVNIYGLTFSNVETLRTLKDGDDVTIITAEIRSVVDHTVRVPSVLVSILNAGGEPIYEWTARTPVQNISPGDVVEFQTQLTSAPTDAAHVRLVFGGGNAADGAAP